MEGVLGSATFLYPLLILSTVALVILFVVGAVVVSAIRNSNGNRRGGSTAASARSPTARDLNGGRSCPRPGCGQDVSHEAIFCPRCGVQVSAEKAR